MSSRFDSTLIRLKGKISDIVEGLQDEFRFHTGSIKRIRKLEYLFLFNMSFDSIPVRLKVNTVALHSYNLTSFRFQNGAIKRPHENRQIHYTRSLLNMSTKFSDF